MTDFIRTQGDRVHSISAQLSDASGGLDVPHGTTVSFSGHLLGHREIVIGGNGVIVRADAEDDDPNRGFVRYDLSTDDVLHPGIYYCKWRLVPPGSTQTQSFPEDARMTLLVLPE